MGGIGGRRVEGEWGLSRVGRGSKGEWEEARERRGEGWGWGQRGSAGDVKNSYKNCGVEFLLPGGDLAYLSPVCKHFQNIASASECH